PSLSRQMTRPAVQACIVSSVLMMLVIARASPGQTQACTTSRADSAATNTRWAPPLDRSVTVRAGALPLRDAIDRVASAAKLRVSYSAELLPLDHVVCVEAQSMSAGLLLAELLDGTNVAAIGVGGDQVVLAPRAPVVQKAEVSDMANSVGVLDRVLVTGTATAGVPERELAVGVQVLDGRQLARSNTSDIASALDLYVPGVWAWTRSPSSMMSSYGSIRGASSFGLTYPKMYIDGIEVANPLLVGRFNAASVDRIEVIRGPQGSALYGADAISGVVNIVSRHEGADGDGSVAALRSSAGFSRSDYAHSVLAQDHELSITAGTNARSADLHVSGSSMGSFVPGGYSRDLMASGSAQVVGATSTFSTTARVFMEQAGTPVSPLVAPPTFTNGVANNSFTSGPGSGMGGGNASVYAPANGGQVLSAQSTTPQSVSEYTLGASATTSPNDRWTHSFVAGIDGYRLANVQTSMTPIPSAADAALAAAEGNADRGTLRATSELHLNNGEATRATFTLSAEHTTLRAATVADAPIVMATQLPVRVANPMGLHGDDRVTTWQNSTGLTAQTNVAFSDLLFLTGGLRAEHDSRLAESDALELLPMLGVGSVREMGPLTVKLRAAYGKGIRPPTTPTRTQLWQVRDGALTQAPLGPERQSGIESGIDFYFQHALSLQVTHFDQRASGLVQQVAIPADSVGVHRMLYVAQNVGEISNRGWEFQATSNISRLAVTGSLSLVDSRVQKLAPGYSGDLVTGDRMLQVPAQTGGLNATWTERRWFLSLGGTRALNWVNYDQLALAEAFNSTTHSRDLTGDRLRQYWRNYDGGLHLRALASRDIRDGFAVELSAENLLNYQTGEPDNLTIVPGRTIMTGVRVKF
ncbi:MAG TPA: TonB-dependent receptor, partial [Gemmatimonadaceae bacterium]